MKLHLVDTMPEMVTAWDRVFSGAPDVEICHGNILDFAEDTIVSPANSYGYMDGGIDKVYRDHFGIKIEKIVQDAIVKTGKSYLPVGSSLMVKTGDEKIPLMIIAPTMFLPEAVKSQNCFYAMSAILNIYSKSKENIKNIYCPGLGTGVGQVDPIESAKEMKAAYLKWHQASDK
ncbi:MAG TPA: AraC family transcriptional regulator [Gammaproteobacteria bacterium]|nr:AraC family transcriptional regulator [Gammaproteobacteria bacterium]